ncbi:hypothetical protein Tco_0598970 [Tanacetum coccineum]
MIALLSFVYEVQLLYERTQTPEGNVANFENHLAAIDVPLETSRPGHVFCWVATQCKLATLVNLIQDSENNSGAAFQKKIPESLLGSLHDLSLRFGATSLEKQCEEAIKRFKLNKKLFDSGKNV